MLVTLASAYASGRLLGLVVLALLLVLLVRRIVLARRTPRSRLTDSIAACVVAALLVAGVMRAAGDEGGSWSSAEGTEMRAGFIQGCESSAGGVVDCGCTFDALTSAPAYDTPKELASLAPVLRRAEAANDVGMIPQEYVTAARSCVRA